MLCTPRLSHKLISTDIWGVYLCLHGNRLNFLFRENFPDGGSLGSGDLEAFNYFYEAHSHKLFFGFQISWIFFKRDTMTPLISPLVFKPNPFLTSSEFQFLFLRAKFNPHTQHQQNVLSIGLQPARFFSLLLATFDVFLLLLKALRKLAAPVRRRNQNMLQSNLNFLVWVIKSKIFFPVSDMSWKRSALIKGLIWTETAREKSFARVYFRKPLNTSCATAQASPMNFTLDRIMFGFSLRCTGQDVNLLGNVEPMTPHALHPIYN